MDDAGAHPGGRAWFDSILADENARHLEVAAAVRARALADKALLDIFVDAAAGMEQAQQALVIAREVDEPALLSRALTACGLIAVAVARADAAASYFAEAIDLARAVDDRWRLAQILTFRRSMRSWRVTRSRHARPPKRHASWLPRSVTTPMRCGAAGVSATPS